MDIPKLRKMDFVNKTIALTQKLQNQLEFPDQDVVNILFQNNIKRLDCSFNYFANMIPLRQPKNPNQPIEPKIIHYTNLKPWKNHTLFQQDFDDILKTSVFYKQIIKKYRSKKISKFYLFGFIPLFSHITPQK